jgi:hypothetical protein
MEKFAAEKYMAICSNLSILAPQANKLPDVLPDFAKKEICNTLQHVAQECRAIGLKSTALQFEDVIFNVENLGIRGDQLAQILLCLGSAIRAEMSTHLFMQIFPNRIDYYEQRELFGAAVATNFPSAARDIRSSGSCYACDRNTASVMHGMRVLELGLNTFASTLDVVFEKRNWENIINDIEKEIKQRNGPHAGTDWKQKQKFYSGAAKDFRYFKDAWRNHAMHFREHYDAAEALTILNHVKAFMEHLADGGLKEVT